MANTKNAMIRYKILDKCFSNVGKRYYIEDLIDECSKVLEDRSRVNKGIGRSQIFEDIKFMESVDGWNIELLRIKDGRRKYYRYEDPNFSINNMPLNDTEITHLKEASSILSTFEGMPQFDWINEIVFKLNNSILNENQNLIMSFEQNEFLKGKEYIGEFYNAILYKKVIKLTYKPFQANNEIEFNFHPYFLKQYNNRWFVFGHNENINIDNWNVALDRIVAIAVANKEYKINENINWKNYFEDIIGVSKPAQAEIENIILHFYGIASNYIITKPIHGSQKPPTQIDENTIEIKLSLIINYELIQLLLSYGENVKVISPKSLQQKISERITLANELYK